MELIHNLRLDGSTTETMTSTAASPSRSTPTGGNMGMDISDHPEQQHDDDDDAAAAATKQDKDTAVDTVDTVHWTPEQQMHRRRAAAIQQADDVLTAVGGSMQLDGLNLLGVVASPRRLPGLTGAAAGSGSMSALSMLSPSSVHGRYNQSGGGGGGGGSTASSSPSVSAHATSAAVAANHVSSSNAVVPAGTSSSMLLHTDYLTDTYNTIEMTLSHVTEQMDVWNQVLEDFSRQILEDGDYDGDAVMESVLSADKLPFAMQDLELQSQLQRYLETCGPLAQNL